MSHVIVLSSVLTKKETVGIVVTNVLYFATKSSNEDLPILVTKPPFLSLEKLTVLLKIWQVRSVFH